MVERRSLGPYSLLTLLAPAVAAVARPGQFVMVALPGSRFRLRRPLSLHSVDGERVRLLVEPRGEGSRELAEAGVADVARAGRPAGQRLPARRRARRAARRRRHRRRPAAVRGRRAARPRRGGHGRLRLSRPRARPAWSAPSPSTTSGWPPTTAASAGAAARSTRRARSGAGPRASVLACGPAPMLAATQAWAAAGGPDGLRLARGAHGLRHRRLPRLRRAHRARATCGSASRGRCSPSSCCASTPPAPGRALSGEEPL